MRKSTKSGSTKIAKPILSKKSKPTDRLKETSLSQKQVFKGSFLTVWRDDVQMPDGTLTTREYIQHPGAAVILPVLENGDLILVRQYRHPLRQNFLEFPAGKRDPGENFLETAHRELEEEVGYKADRMKFLTTIYPVIGYANERMDLFLATQLRKGTQKLDHGEAVEVVKMSLSKLMKEVWAGRVPDVKTQIGAFWLQQQKRRNS